MELEEKISIMYDRLLSKPMLKLRDKEMYYFGVPSGIYYGYPDCCISDFALRFQKGSKPQTESQHKTHNFVGFIPCPKCAEKILSGKTTQAKLIENRLCDYKFPNDGCEFSPSEERMEIEKRVLEKLKQLKQKK